MANRKSSPSNVAERPVVSGSKRAGTKDIAIGHALAMMVLQRAEEEGQRQLTMRESRKDILRKIIGFPSDAAHVEFRKVLDEKMTSLKAEADAGKLTLNAYTEANPIAASVRVECSLWRKMDEAVASGFAPDLDKPWPEISTKATEHLASKATGSGLPVGKGGKGKQVADSKARGRKPTPVLDKAKQWAQSNLLDEKTKQVKKDVNLSAIIGMMLMTATVAQCDEVIAECVRIRDMKVKMEADMAAKVKKEAENAAKLAADSTKPTTMRAISEAIAEVSKTKQGATVRRTKAEGPARKGAVPSTKQPEQKEAAPVARTRKARATA